MNKNRVVVHLMGHDYTMVTDQSPEKVQRLSRYVDRRMRELAILTRARMDILENKKVKKVLMRRLKCQM